jgi:hypothetical protein
MELIRDAPLTGATQLYQFHSSFLPGNSGCHVEKYNSPKAISILLTYSIYCLIPEQKFGHLFFKIEKWSPNVKI